MWKKVIAPTAVVSVLWVLATCSMSYILNQVDETQTRLLNMNRNVMHAGGAMQENLWRLQAGLLEAAEHLENGGKLRENFKVEAQQVENAFNLAKTLAYENSSTPAEQDLIRTIGENFTRYRTTSRAQLARNDLAADASAAAIEAAMNLATAVAEPCEQLSELAQRLTNDTFQRRDRLRAQFNMARIAFAIVGPAVGILLGLWVARGLHHSISEISVTLRDASGDLEQEIGLVEVHPHEELGGLPALQHQVQYVSGRIKQVVEELQWTRREALRSERLAEVGELAAGVAHEVRNPLTSVKLLIQAIERNQSPASSDKQRLQIVQQEIGRIETTMQELLDYARPPKLRRVRHDVRETLRRSLNLAAGRAQQSAIAIHEQLGSTPMVVDADPEQLQQVFINLMLNAIEAMSDGGALHVAIEGPAEPPAQAGPSDGHQLLRITFRDTGSGIPADVMDRLFEPFVTSKERGIGLGLAISRQIMREHGGGLTACNPPPSGAMFVVKVPLAEPGASGALACVATSDRADGDSADGGRASETLRAEATATLDH